MTITDADRFKLMAEILDKEGGPRRPWRFYCTSDPFLTLDWTICRGVQYGMIAREELPAGPGPIPSWRLLFQDGAADVTSPRLAAALYFQPEVSMGRELKEWLEAKVEARLAERMAAEARKTPPHSSEVARVAALEARRQHKAEVRALLASRGKTEREVASAEHKARQQAMKAEAKDDPRLEAKLRAAPAPLERDDE